MATNNVLEYKWDHLVKQEDDDDDDEEHVEEEEEEALSLCDLPVTLINYKDQEKPRKQDTQLGETEEQEEEEEDFDFNSWGGVCSEEPEMCVADEVFFQGQILPLRHSFSSEPCLSKIKESQMQHDGSNKQFNRCESRSESMDHVSTSEFGSNSNSSSRSCSLRSQNSSSSTSSTTTTTPPIRVSKPKIRNQFHTIQSPKPQLRQSRSGTRQTIFSFGNQGRKSSSSSSAWEFFRLGVVPAPEMLGLQDLKFRNSSGNRNCVSRNSSSSSSNNNSTTCNAKSSVKKISNKIGHEGDKSNNHVLKQFVGKGGGLLSGCSCTVDSVVSQLDTVMIKSTNTKTQSVATTHAMKEKVVVAKLKKEQNKKKHNNNNNNRQKHQAKKVMSRRRTFEWLKELHAIRHPEDEEALLSNT